MNEKMKQVLLVSKKKVAQVGTAVAGLGASALALASPTSPGAAISAEIAGGKTEVMLVIAAVAVILGALILWAYVKRAR